jgi:amidase
MTREQVRQAVEFMSEAAERALEASSHVDIVLTPTLADEPAPIGALRDDADPERDFEAQKRFTPFTSPYNMTGQPAVSLPLHWATDGLPIGVQLVGRPVHDTTLLSLAAQLERAQPWAHRHPEVW